MSGVVSITLRLHRFEVLAVLGGSLALTAAALLISLRLGAIEVPISCFGQPDVHGATGSSIPECAGPLTSFGELNAQAADRLFAILVAFPVLAGMLLGVAAVSREIEHGTALLPWTLSGQRRRWLLRRIVILGLVLIAGLIPLALAADLLEAVRNPLALAERSFGSEGLRGGVLVARGVGGFGTGVLLGLIIGRQLPAVIVGLVASAALITGGLVAMELWSKSVAEYVPLAQARLGDRPIVAAYRGKDGRIVSSRDIVALIPPRSEVPPGAIDDQWVAENFEEVLLIVSGRQYPEDVAVHSALLSGVAVIALVASLAMVDTRRLR